jgi:PEP-CTERM motif
MKRKANLLFAAVTFIAAPRAMGQTYTGSVLYLPTVPSGFDNVSYGNFACVYAGQTAGSGFISGTNNSSEHALLWTTSGAVDLNPTNLSGISNSVAISTSDTQQVGLGTGHALLWTGTAASAVDLNPNGFTASEAFGTNGTQQVGCGFVGGSGNGTFDGATGDFAVEWSLVPEPATGWLLLIGGAGLLIRRRRKQLA